MVWWAEGKGKEKKRHQGIAKKMEQRSVMFGEEVEGIKLWLRRKQSSHRIQSCKPEKNC